MGKSSSSSIKCSKSFRLMELRLVNGFEYVVSRVHAAFLMLLDSTINYSRFVYSDQ